LFLVDAPLYLQHHYTRIARRNRPTLRLPYAQNRGGILLPPLLELDGRDDVYYSIFDSLKAVFLHEWQRRLLFYSPAGFDAFPAQALCYVLSNSLWQTNLQYLTKQIRYISFHEIRNPDLGINNKLHDRREDLVAFIKPGLVETTSYIPQECNNFFEEMRNVIFTGAATSTPVSAHRKTLQEAIELERFLMETFQLLMSSISVQDAQMSVAQGHLSNQQALRATQLTILASIYVPLSFVTGIFGMNLKELNGSNLSIWVFFVAVVIAAMITALIFMALREHSKHKRKVAVDEDKEDLGQDQNGEHKKKEQKAGHDRQKQGKSMMKRIAWKTSEKDPMIETLMA
jgi:CorA-like Mg2+ transporter protein